MPCAVSAGGKSVSDSSFKTLCFLLIYDAFDQLLLIISNHSLNALLSVIKTLPAMMTHVKANAKLVHANINKL